MKKTAVILLLLFLSISSCKKYPDGPLISLRTKEHRMVGNWDVEYFEVDGADSTSYLKSQSFYAKYQFKKGDYGSGEFKYITDDASYGTVGSWIFSNRKKYLELSLRPLVSANHIGPYGADYVVWEIRRLKEKELWLKTIYNGKEYFLKLQQ